jgi:hypothetical protein
MTSKVIKKSNSILGFQWTNLLIDRARTRRARLSEAKRQQEEFISMMLQRAVSETTEVCDQCGKFSLSCPVSKYIEGFNPRQLIAKVSLKKLSELLVSEFLWMCAGEFNKWLKMVFILLSVFGGSFSLYVSSPSSCTFVGF